MFYRSWLILLAAFILIAPRSAVGISLGRQPQEGASAHATSAALPEKTAGRVLGQSDFNTNDSGTSATTMNGPAGIAIAPASAPNAGRLFVVEYYNHRVLSWPNAASFTSGEEADLVIGQEDFISGDGALAQNRFYHPEAVVVDAAGNLWVADTENNRVLRFDYPLSSGMYASIVLGQPDFDSSNLPNQGGVGPAANTMYYPRGLALDVNGYLYVADDANNRVLGFAAPFAYNMNAFIAIGQQDLYSGDPNQGLTAGQNTLSGPKGIAIDAAGNLYVAEYGNNRVTRFSPAFFTGMLASGVYGQPDFVSDSPNRGSQTPQNNTLYSPVDVAVSAAGDVLYVTDQQNVRVLAFSNPVLDFPGTSVADQVYGQPDFTSATPNNGGISASSINQEPLGVAVDTFGDLYLADYQNNRLLAYDSSTLMVGDGTPGSCTEAALDTALANAGRIAFDCGTAQIDLSSAKLISAGRIIDGGDTITLKGGGTDRLFVVDAGAELILRNIAMADGNSTGDGGAIYNEGILTLEDSTIRNSMAAASGGAIVSYGALTIRDSLLEGNSALNGGALYPRWSGAQTTIVNSVLRDNHATDSTNGWGGAILSWDGAQVSIEGSDIYSNTARDGGGIYNFANSSLYLAGKTLLRDNIADNNGGSIFNSGGMALTDVTISGNIANDGGGLFNDAGTAWLTNVTLNGNSADYGGGIANYAALNLTNVTVSGNTASSYGGGLRNYDAATLTNVTLSNNSAPSGGGISMFGGTVTFKNSIVAYSPQGGNCGGAPLTNDNSDKSSLSSDNTCALAGTGSMNGVDPLLMDLGDYGGPTQVHMLSPGSLAIDGVLGSDAPDTDQRGVARPQGNGFDIGAVEVTESDFVKKVYLPLAIR